MGRSSLLKRIFALNVAAFALAGAALAFTPATVSSEIARLEAAVLVLVLAATAAVDFLLLRRALGPLHRLTRLMEEVEPLHPGRRLPDDGAAPEEIRRLTVAFNGMLARLEEERRRSVERSLGAQEAERLRVAQELHDGIGQSLTALMLQVDRAARSVPAEDPIHGELCSAREAARTLLGEVREVATRLRPEALDDLGLVNALQALCARVGEQSGIAVRLSVDAGLPPLSPEAELVVFRVAQEALSNTLRHAEASAADLTLAVGDDGTVTLRASDDGRGLGGSVPGAGIQGMHERALLLGGTCRLRTLETGGTEVALRLRTAAVVA